MTFFTKQILLYFKGLRNFKIHYKWFVCLFICLAHKQKVKDNKYCPSYNFQMAIIVFTEHSSVKTGLKCEILLNWVTHK